MGQHYSLRSKSEQLIVVASTSCRWDIGWKPVPRLNLVSAGGWFHELDRCAIGVAHVNDTLPGVRAGLQCLRFPRDFPTGLRDLAQHRIEIIDNQGDVDRS